MADFLGLGFAEFRRRFVTMKWGRPSFRERPNFDCVFYDAETARWSIYAVRPSQCRAFPFWPELLRSQSAWDAAARKCPGMNEGPLLTPEDIAEWQRRAGLIQE